MMTNGPDTWASEKPDPFHAKTTIYVGLLANESKGRNQTIQMNSKFTSVHWTSFQNKTEIRIDVIGRRNEENGGGVGEVDGEGGGGEGVRIHT